MRSKIEPPAEPPLDPTLGGARPARLECDETGKPRSLVLLPSFMRDDPLHQIRLDTDAADEPENVP